MFHNITGDLLFKKTIIGSTALLSQWLGEKVWNYFTYGT